MPIKTAPKKPATKPLSETAPEVPAFTFFILNNICAFFCKTPISLENLSAVIAATLAEKANITNTRFIPK